MYSVVTKHYMYITCIWAIMIKLTNWFFRMKVYIIDAPLMTRELITNMTS